MRTASVSKIKGKRQGAACRQSAPRAGTALRALYDHFMAHRGLVTTLPAAARGKKRSVPDLRDYYGLDIRLVRRGQWLLAGEWFGRVYVDYVAERIADREAA